LQEEKAEEDEIKDNISVFSNDVADDISQEEVDWELEKENEKA